MTKRFEPSRLVVSLFVCAALLFLGISTTMAQSPTTGALTGTVTDPSGAVISGATVTTTNINTGQLRTATTDADGSYKLSLLPPGNYRVTFSAKGFKVADVPSVTVNVTETPVLSQSLEVGAETQQVTVQATAET